MNRRPNPLTGLGAMLSPECWNALCALGEPRTYRPDGVLMRQGGDCGVVLVLLRGRVKITLSEPDGFEAPIAVRHRGEVLGDIAALDLRPHTATVTAIDLCSVRVVLAAHFKWFVATHRLEPVIARHHRTWLQEAEGHRAELAAFPVDQRLCQVLLRLAREDERGRHVVDVRMSQEELGRMIGASRNAVSLVLGRLRDLGIVTTCQLTVVIEDIDALRTYAKGNPPDSYRDGSR